MRHVLVSLGALVLFAGFAGADPQNLASGALITHDAGGWYRSYGPDCYNYFQFNPISSCEEQVTTLQLGLRSWFVIAAFEEDKEWCGVEFGFSNYDPDPMAIYEYGACYPEAGLEIPTPGWPGPNEGTAFVRTGTPWIGNWLPVYCFVVYAYDYTYGSTVVQLTPNPATGFGGFCNCTNPPQMYPAALGGMGVNCPGVEVCWGWQVFVCCVDTDCVLVHGEEECTTLGGVFHPEWDTCGPPNPCSVTPALEMSWGRIKALYR